jgi:Cu/Ag efflux protein CusF
LAAERRTFLRLSAVALTSLALVSSPSIPPASRLHAQPQPSTERTFSTHGTVRRVLPDSRLVLVAHDEIAGLMEAMDSMAFSADEFPVLRNVKPGDRIRFTLRQSGSTMTLLRIDLAR